MLFLLPVVLQVVDGYSPLESGVALLPITVVMLAFSARSGRLAAAIGPRLQMSVGPIVVGGGLALFSRSPTSTSYVAGVLPGVLVLAVGLAVTVAPLTSTALNSVSESHAGVASAVNNDVARLGSLIAVAVLPALGGIDGLSYLHPHPLAQASSGRWSSPGPGAWPVGSSPPSGSGTRTETPGHHPAAGQLTHCALEATPLLEAGPR